MKVIKNSVCAIFMFILISAGGRAAAQCAMCTLNAENSVKNGNTQGKGLNDGILYLLAAPYLAVAGIGFLWYKKYRKKNVALNMKNERIHMN